MELPTSLTFGDTLVMRPLPELRSRLAFGPFEFDAVAEDLRKHGHRIRLAGQPLQILSALLLQFGEVVSRKILLRQFWAGSKGLEGWDATYPAETRDYVGKVIELSFRQEIIKRVAMCQTEFPEFSRAYGAIKLVASLAAPEVVHGGFFNRI